MASDYLLAGPAGIAEIDCFFTNAYMGVRTGLTRKGFSISTSVVLTPGHVQAAAKQQQTPGISVATSEASNASEVVAMLAILAASDSTPRLSDASPLIQNNRGGTKRITAIDGPSIDVRAGISTTNLLRFAAADGYLHNVVDGSARWPRAPALPTVTPCFIMPSASVGFRSGRLC